MDTSPVVCSNLSAFLHDSWLIPMTYIPKLCTLSMHLNYLNNEVHYWLRLAMMHNKHRITIHAVDNVGDLGDHRLWAKND